MLLYPFPAQSRPAPPRPTGIAERASFHSHLEKPRSRLHPYLSDNPDQSRASEAMPAPRTSSPPTRAPPTPSERSDARHKHGPFPFFTHPQPTRKTQGAPVSPERFRSNSAKPNCEDQRRGNRGARWEQNGLLTRGAAAACAARYRRVGAADAQSGRGIRDEDGPPPPRVREPRAYQDDRARSCPSRPLR